MHTDLVIDTNIYYTFLGESSYSENIQDTWFLLQLIRYYCENRVCMCPKINAEFKKFKEKLETKPLFPIFQAWETSMLQSGKILLRASGPQVNIDIHEKDRCFYELACQTNSKIVVTQEKKHIEKKGSILEEIGVRILTIQEAIDFINENKDEN